VHELRGHIGAIRGGTGAHAAASAGGQVA
jgi:hypothetical protein